MLWRERFVKTDNPIDWDVLTKCPRQVHSSGREKRWSAYGRGAFQQRRRSIERTAGAVGSENAGMSSDKEGENPSRRKPKDS